MADKIVLVDTSILIDYYLRTDKEKSVWISLIRKGYSFALSAVTKYELYAGAISNQLTFWDTRHFHTYSNRKRLKTWQMLEFLFRGKKRRISAQI